MHISLIPKRTDLPPAFGFSTEAEEKEGATKQMNVFGLDFDHRDVIRIKRDSLLMHSWTVAVGGHWVLLGC
jgi:hypothetical protein